MDLRRFVGLVVAAACLVVVLAVASGPGASAQPEVTDPTRCPEHPPIAITEDVGDDGFVLGPELAGIVVPTYRPDSGVVGGLGTPGSPYVIQGWCITRDAPSFTSDTSNADAAIRIENTTAHVEIRRNELPEAGSFDHGILVRNAENVDVRENHVAGNALDGVRVDTSRYVEVTGNTIEANDRDGVRATGSNVVDVRENTVTGNAGIGIHLDGGQSAIAQANTIDDNDGGLRLSGVSKATLADNEVQDNANGGITVVGGDTHTIEDNEVRGSPVLGYGIDVSTSNGNTVRGNLVRGTGHGIGLHGSDKNTVEANTVRATSGYGVLVSASGDNVVRDNTIEDNAWHGVRLRGTDTLVAGNTIAGNADGVHVRPSATGATIEGNAIVDNQQGIAVDEGDVDRIQRNDIEGNDDTGLTVTSVSSAVNATDNWWGDSSGPSGGETDACDGTPANGTGQAISVTDGGVCFHPWREAPVG